MLTAVRTLLDLFGTLVSDQGTLQELRYLIDHEAEWIQAHRLFERIRRKTLVAEKTNDLPAACQYLFEEACAQTLYNLTDCDDPFDEETPYWIVPCALSLARALDISEAAVTRVVAA